MYAKKFLEKFKYTWHFINYSFFFSYIKQLFKVYIRIVQFFLLTFLSFFYSRVTHNKSKIYKVLGRQNKLANNFFSFFKTENFVRFIVFKCYVSKNIHTSHLRKKKYKKNKKKYSFHRSAVALDSPDTNHKTIQNSSKRNYILFLLQNTNSFFFSFQRTHSLVSGLKNYNFFLHCAAHESHMYEEDSRNFELFTGTIYVCC